MASEDHPKYPEWLAAATKLKTATDHYNETLRLNPSEEPAARRDLDRAQIEYDKISDEID